MIYRPMDTHVDYEIAFKVMLNQLHRAVSPGYQRWDTAYFMRWLDSRK